MNTQLVDLSRLQFALTVAFHMLFPSITVGLSVLLVVLYGTYLKTKQHIYLIMYRFWRNIFAVGFGLGIVAGIVITFEFGLNWAGYANAVGPIVGVIISMEVITAFFLEAGFLGIMLYGEGRVGQRTIFVANCMVALGTLLSTTWILSANSWMQTPAGYAEINGQFRPTNWLAAIFNPSFFYRYPHMLLGVLLSAAFLVTGIAAWYLLKRRHLEFARRTFSLGLGVIAILVPLQLFAGDSVAFAMESYQPPKMLAAEGNWNSTNTGDFLFIITDQQDQRNIVEIGVPLMGSIIWSHDFTFTKPVPGLQTVPLSLQPPMMFVFYSFHLMVYLGVLMFFVGFLSLLLRLRGQLYTARWFQRLALLMTPAGLVAIIGGWMTAETGRQPWVVYGKLLTNTAVSPLSPGVVIASLIGFIATYAALFTIYIVYLVRAVRKGPEAVPALTPPPEGSPEARVPAS